MIVNAEPQGFAKKHGVDLRLMSLAWENILPAVASASGGADVGFGSLAEYLAKEENINRGSADPLVFIYPLYVYKGGGFVSFESSVPALDRENLADPVKVRAFLSHTIGAQKNSIYEMMVFSLARKVDRPISSVKVMDVSMDDGLLAASAGSLDISSAGLTQSTEARKRNGRIVLTMESLGFADITGFICKRSVFDSRRAEVEGLIRAWFDSVAFVMSDVDRNSSASLEYLQSSAATRYTLEQYKAALSQEYLPRSVDEARQTFMVTGGAYNLSRIGMEMSAYLVQVRGQKAPSIPSPVDLK